MSDLSQRSGSPYWLIVRESARRDEELEIFSLDLGSGKQLPLFHSGESAERLRRHLRATGSVAEGEWRIRATGAGELISLLSGSAFAAGPCAGIERVLLDPRPEALDRAVNEGDVEESLMSESRSCFLERLMGRGRPWFETREQKESK